MSIANSHSFMVDIEGTELSKMERDILQHPHVGAVILFTRNFTDLPQLHKLIKEIKNINANLFVAVDQEGGFVQRFLRQGFRALPAARIYGDVYDLNPKSGIQLARQYGEIMARDLLTCGIDLSLAPVLDVHDVSMVIAHLDRAFHTDPEVIATLAGAFIEGMNAVGMPAVGKHFPGHGSVVSDSHVAMPISHASLEELKVKDLKPFIELIKKGLLSAIMPAHVTYTAIDATKPAGFSKTWLQEILRSELGFTGLVLSDCLSMTGADIGNLMTRAEEALQAGCDMLIVCHQPRSILLELLQTITWVQPPESAARIVYFKSQMHRFSDTPKKQIAPGLSQAVLEPISITNSPSENVRFNTTQTV